MCMNLVSRVKIIFKQSVSKMRRIFSGEETFVHGFTLLELLVVIAILGVLASVVLASLRQGQEEGRIASTQRQLQELYKATLLLYHDTGFYPSGRDGVTDICIYPGKGNEIHADNPNAGLISNGRGWSGWNGPYIGSPYDPWGNPYLFDSNFRCFANVAGCKGIEESSPKSSVIASCGPSGTNADGECDYDPDNIVLRLCTNDL